MLKCLEVSYSSFFTQRPIFHRCIHSPKLIWAKHCCVRLSEKSWEMFCRAFLPAAWQHLCQNNSPQKKAQFVWSTWEFTSFFCSISCYHNLFLHAWKKRIKMFQVTTVQLYEISHKRAFWNGTACVMQCFNWMSYPQQPAVQRHQLYLKLLKARRKEMANSKINSSFMRQNEIVVLAGTCGAREG